MRDHPTDDDAATSVAPQRFLIATATTRHRPESGLADRPQLVNEINRMADLFRQMGYRLVPGFGADMSADLWRRGLRGFLTHPDRREDDTIVVYHTGHGIADGDQLLLPMADTGADVTDAVWVEDLTKRLLHTSRVRRLLIILDTCHAALGGAAAASGAHAFLARLRGLDTNPSIAILVSARPLEEAQAGAFTQAFVAAVHNPATAGHEPRYVSLDALLGVINATTPEYQHARLFLITDEAAEFLPNLRYQPAVRDLDLWTQQRLLQRRRSNAGYSDHVLPRAQGLDTAGLGDLWLYTGRYRALRDVCMWLGDAAAPATMIVTGDPGSGKSALLSRLFVLASKDLQGRVPNKHTLPVNTIPPTGVFAEFIHARGLRPQALLAAISHACGLDPEATLTELVSAVQARRMPITLIVDAVDEALDELDGESPFPAVDRVLAPLIHLAARRHQLRLLVGTRRHLVTSLGGPTQLVNLDDDTYADPASLRTYTTACLTRLVDTSPYRHQPHPYLSHVAEAIAAAAAQSFLVALITARSFAMQPDLVDPADSAWRAGLPTIPADAMRADLTSRLGADADTARALLLPLAYAEGSGLPWEDFWPTLASALSNRHYTSADLDWLIRFAGFYMIETTAEQNRSVYRLYHEALAEHLRDGRDEVADQTRLVDQLIARAPRLDDGHTDWATAHPYTRTNLATHAARAQRIDTLLLDPRYLLHAAPEPLHAALAAASNKNARAAAHAYRHAAPHLHGTTPLDQKAAYLGLAAACVHATALTSAIRKQNLPLAWITDAARWQPGIPHQTLRGHTSPVISVALGRVAGRDVIVSGSDDAAVRVWDAATGTPTMNPLTGHTGRVTSVVVGLVDGRDVIVSGSDDATVRVWDAAAHTATVKALGHTRGVTSVAIGRVAGRDVIVSGGHDAHVRVWDAATGTPIMAALSGHTGPVTSVAMGLIDDRDVIVSGSRDAKVRVWDAATGTPIMAALSGHTGWVRSVAVGRIDDRDVIVSGSIDATVRVWDAATGTPTMAAIIRHASAVMSVAVGPVAGRNMIVSGSQDATVRVWDPSTGRSTINPITGHTGVVWSVAVGRVRGRDVIVSGSNDHTVRAWDAATHTATVNKLSGHTDRVSSVAVGRVDGRDVIVSGSQDVTVRIWDAAEGTPIMEALTGHTGGVTSVALGRIEDRDVIVSGSQDATVRVWDAANGIPTMAAITGHTGPVTSVAVGHLGNRNVIVSGSRDATVRVWDASASKSRAEPTAEIDVGAPVNSIVFSGPDRLAVGADAGILAIRLPG